jgi:hypothetical protein
MKENNFNDIFNNMFNELVLLEKELIKRKDEVNELRQVELKLQALEAAGVDNWEGYDEAMCLYKEFLNNKASK